MINSVRNTVLSVINKNNYGYITPADFNLYAKQAQMVLYEGYYSSYNKSVNMENARMSGSDYADTGQPLEETLESFLVTANLDNYQNNKWLAPSVDTTGSDAYMILRVDCLDGSGNRIATAEKVSNGKIMMLSDSNLTVPSLSYPSYTYEQNANGVSTIVLYPDTISDDNSYDVRCTYFSFPKDPKWTYVTLSNGEPMFDQSQPDYQDFQLPNEDEYKLVVKILQYAGISIREQEVAAYAVGQEQIQQQQIIMAYLTDYQYYENGGNNPENENWGSYQYVSLKDIVNNFMLMYVGNNKLVNNVDKYEILFHAKRGIQEINYDALKEIKVVELSICDDLKLVLPPDYVNYVRISLYKDGVLRPLSENIQTNYSNSYLQDNSCRVLFDQDGNVLEGTSILDYDRIHKLNKSIYLGDGKFSGLEGYNVGGNWYFDYTVGSRFGLNTETANINPTYRIDKKSGVINFGSGMAGQLCILEYITDGMENGDDSEVSINKLAEEFLYAYIKYNVLTNKYGVQEYVVNRAKKEKTALLRNAKIRLSNIHPGRLLMNMRGKDKWIK